MIIVSTNCLHIGATLLAFFGILMLGSWTFISYVHLSSNCRIWYQPAVSVA